MGDRSAVKVSFLGDAVSLARAAHKARQELGGVAQASNKLGTKAKAGLAIGTTAVVGFAKAASDKFAQVGSETVKLRRYIGGTVEDASRLRFAAEQSGVGVDDLAKGLGKFSKAIVAAKDKTKTMTSSVEVATGAWRKQTTIVKDANGHFQTLSKMVPVTRLEKVSRVISVTNPMIEKLGFAVRDAKGNMLPMSELLPKVAEKFKNMKDGPEKTALALALFGKAGMSLMPFLNKGAAGIKELSAQSDEFGNTLTEKDTAALKANTIAKRKWKAVISGLQIQLGRGLLPALTAMATALGKATKFASDHSTIIKPLAALLATLAITTIAINKAMAAGRAIQAAALGVKALFVTTTNAETGAQSRGVLALIAHKAAMVGGMVATGAMTAATWLLNVALSANPLALVVIAVVALVAAIVIAYRKSETFRTIVQAAFRMVGNAFSWAWGLIKGGFAWLGSHWKLILAILTGPIGLAVLFITSHFDQIVGFVKKLPGRIKSVASGMFDGIKDAFKSAINWLIRAWNGLNFTIPSIDTHIPGIGKVGGFTLGTPDIPQLAKGGLVKARRGGTLVNVGEGGQDEVVAPLDRVTGGGRDGALVVNLHLDGKVIHTSLLSLKNTRGGKLGLA